MIIKDEKQVAEIRRELQIEKKHWYKKWWGIGILLFLAIFFVFVSIFIYELVKLYRDFEQGTLLPDKEAFERQADYDMEMFIDERVPVLGTEDAPIKIIEFGDFNCPYCKQAAGHLRKIMNKYPDQVKVYWLNMPVVTEASFLLAAGGVCAHAQDKFWSYHDALLDHSGESTAEDMVDLAFDLNMDAEKWDECITHKLTIAKVRKDLYLSEDVDAQGTPTFLINGVKVAGVVTLAKWEELVELLLTVYDQ